MSRNFIPDHVLIDQLPLNDTGAFEELHRRYCFPLYAYCNGKLRSNEDARKIVRDIFISIWEQRHELPVNFSISLHCYLEVRKAVVKCVNEKLIEGADLTSIEENIIPGFSVENLQLAKIPTRNNNVKPEFYPPAAIKSSNNEQWWHQFIPQLNMRGFRYAFQRVMHLW